VISSIAAPYLPFLALCYSVIALIGWRGGKPGGSKAELWLFVLSLLLAVAECAYVVSRNVASTPAA